MLRYPWRYFLIGRALQGYDSCLDMLDADAVQELVLEQVCGFLFTGFVSNYRNYALLSTVNFWDLLGIRAGQNRVPCLHRELDFESSIRVFSSWRRNIVTDV